MKKIKRPPEDKLQTQLKKFRLPILALLSLLALLLAWHNRFMQDDAFISFVYSKGLAQGRGLEWFGSRVQGYTNFLWVLWIALGLKLGAGPIAWSYVGGLSAFAVMLVMVGRMALAIFDDYLPAILAVILLATNYTVSAFATSGLETMLQTALLAVAMFCLVTIRKEETIRPATLLIISLCLSAAVLTRLDSALPGAIIGGWALWTIYRRRVPARQYLALILPFAIIVGAWSFWTVAYYGRFFPNTYYAKVGRDVSVNRNGFVYLYRFFHWYFLWPFLVAGVVVMAWKRGKFPAAARLAPLLAVAAAWLAYIIFVGGDFMEFRFMVPVAPYLFLMLAGLIYYPLGKLFGTYSGVAALLSILVLGGASFYHARKFSGMTADKTLDSIPALADFYGHYPEKDWDRIGKRLKEDLAGTDAVMACHAVGAIPYYSDLKTIDMWGLADRYVAEHGTAVPKDYRRPGHRRHATLSYLKAQQVNLIIGDPTILRGSIADPRLEPDLKIWARNVALAFNREPIGEATLVAMPLDHGESLLMWYLTPTEKIGAALRARRWEIRKITVP